jgi:polar amino acid transport system substrate-binding protein
MLASPSSFRLAAVLALFWLQGSGPVRAENEIRVGMDTRSRPWAFVPGLDYSKEDWNQPPRITAAQLQLLQGPDVEFVKALAQRLHATIKIVPCAWAHIEAGLAAKDFDLLVNAWVPSQHTPPAIIASAPYYDWGLVVVVRANNQTINSYKDLEGVRLGFFRDAAVERTVTSLGAKLLPYDDSDVLFGGLASKEVDAVAEDSTYVKWRIAHDESFRIVGDPLNHLHYYVGLRQEDQELTQKVNDAIRELVGSGEIDRIRKRWEGSATPQ